jgi:hypothetical protein
MDPVTFAFGALGLAGSIGSGVMQAQAGADALSAAKGDAKRLEAIGREEANDRRRATRRLIGRQKVAYAGSGIEIGTGTPLDVLADTVAEEELAALRVEQARREQARSLRYQGRAAKRSADASAFGTILGGVGQAGLLAYDQFGGTDPDGGTDPGKGS